VIGGSAIALKILVEDDREDDYVIQNFQFIHPWFYFYDIKSKYRINLTITKIEINNITSSNTRSLTNLERRYWEQQNKT